MCCHLEFLHLRNALKFNWRIQWFDFVFRSCLQIIAFTPWEALILPITNQVSKDWIHVWGSGCQCHRCQAEDLHPEWLPWTDFFIVLEEMTELCAYKPEKSSIPDGTFGNQLLLCIPEGNYNTFCNITHFGTNFLKVSENLWSWLYYSIKSVPFEWTMIVS